MLMVSTTGEHYGFYRLDETLRPVEAELPEALRLSVERIQENCEPALSTVMFMGGAGGSLRAGVTENPVRLTRSVKEALTRVTYGGAPRLCLARRRHYFHGRRDTTAGQFLRLRSHPGPCRADRVYDAAFRLRRAWRTYGPRPSVEHAHRWGREACAPDRREPMAGPTATERLKA